MKKKLLLLAVIVMAIMCLFAISTSAAEPSYADGEWIYAADGTTKLAIRDTDGNPLIWYMNGEELKWVRADQTDTTQSVYVKYSISAGGAGFDTSKLNPTKTLKDIDIYDNGTQIEGATINSQIVLLNIERLDIDALNGWLFGSKHGCCTIMRGVVLPSTLKGIGQEGFTNTKLVQVWNLENTKLEYVNASNFCATSTLTQEATNGVIKMPQTLECPLNLQGAKIKTYIMNPNSTYNNNQLWHQHFRLCTSLEKLYVPAFVSTTGFGSEAFRDAGSKYLVMFTGNEEQAIALRDNTDTSHNSNFTSATVISYETYIADQETYDNATKVYIIYGVNYCEAFYDNKHDLKISDSCLIGDDCNRTECDYVTTTEFTAHSMKESVTYKDGFANAGEYKCYCSNYELCTVMEGYKVESIVAIFSTTGGYSTNGLGGLAGGWNVNLEMMELYNTHNEDDIQYGILMVNPTHLASEKFFKDDYTVNLADGKEGAILVPSPSAEYSNVSFAVSGFTTTELQNLELVITAYAYVNGEAVEFIQDTTTACKVTTLDYEDGSLYTVNYATARTALNSIPDAIIPSNDEE